MPTKYIQVLPVNHTAVKLEEEISKWGPASTTASLGAFAPGYRLRTHEALRAPLFQGTQNPFQRPWGWFSLTLCQQRPGLPSRHPPSGAPALSATASGQSQGSARRVCWLGSLSQMGSRFVCWPWRCKKEGGKMKPDSQVGSLLHTSLCLAVHLLVCFSHSPVVHSIMCYRKLILSRWTKLLLWAIC